MNSASIAKLVFSLPISFVALLGGQSIGETNASACLNSEFASKLHERGTAVDHECICSAVRTAYALARNSPESHRLKKHLGISPKSSRGAKPEKWLAYSTQTLVPVRENVLKISVGIEEMWQGDMGEGGLGSVATYEVTTRRKDRECNVYSVRTIE